MGKRKPTAVIVAALAAMTFAPTANAFQGGWMSGNDLLALCSTSEPVKMGQCLGYVVGVVDSTGSALVKSTIKHGPIKTPAGVTNGQLRDIVVKYMKENPEYNHMVASDLVFIAIKRAFPN